MQMQASEYGQLDALYRGAPIVFATLLLAGVWTPIVALILALLLLWIGISHRPFDPLPFVLMAIAVSMVMLGPGAWSLDARLFGRKKIDIGGGPTS
jgi:uncharacterized membrane protein YphA (DoxX/SURF4 family)